MIVRKRVPLSDPPLDTSAQIMLDGLTEHTYEREVTLSDILNRLFQYADLHNLDITYYPGNAESGYDDIPVLAANWNTPGEWETKHGYAERYNRTAKIGKWLEWYENAHGGISLEWSDEWTSCSGCNKAVRTSPTSYGWLPSYIQTEYDILCRECWEPNLADIIPEYISNYHYGFSNKALYPEFIPWLESEGFTCWTDMSDSDRCTTYETGFHPHQTDDPKTVFNSIMSDSHNWEVIFVITSTGQFDMDWSVYVRLIQSDDEE